MKTNPVKFSHPRSRVDHRALINYAQAYDFESLSFVWLDDLLTSVDEYLNEIIHPFIWNSFCNVAQCLAFIETQVREKSLIFLVASGWSPLSHLFISTVHKLVDTHIGPETIVKFKVSSHVFDYDEIAAQLRRSCDHTVTRNCGKLRRSYAQLRWKNRSCA